MKIYRINNITSPEFKQWFGNWEESDPFSSRNKEPSSHAVDKEGKPQVMYHGTTKDFPDFVVGLEGTNSGTFGSWKVKRHAIFFTPRAEDAEAFTSSGGKTFGGNIRPVYLDMKSPLDLRHGVWDYLDEFEEVGINPRWLKLFDWGHLDDEDGELFVNAAKKLGYDSIIFMDENPETGDEMETYAVFDPLQVRSIYEV